MTTVRYIGFIVIAEMIEPQNILTVVANRPTECHRINRKMTEAELLITLYLPRVISLQ